MEREAAVPFHLQDAPDLIGHLYRGEMERQLVWRARLDRTTNWAALITGSILTFSFAARERPHYLILGGIVIMLFFLVVEARRYRMYDAWRARVRTLEEHVYAPLLRGADRSPDDWRTRLAEDMERPRFKIGTLEAMQRRLRRIYLGLLAVLLAGWALHLAVFSGPPDGGTVVGSAAVGPMPGLAVVGAVLVLAIGLVVIAVWPHERDATGKMREKDGDWRED